MGALATLLQAVLGAVFGSLWERLFPPKTAADQKANDLQATVERQAAIIQADANAPMSKDDLIARLKGGKICLAFLAMFLLSSCETFVPTACPAPRQWTQKQQDEIAAALDVIPETSPLIAVFVEWARLRAEAKACNGD